jgi:hypothetical protein
MLESFMLFATINAVLLTVELTVSKLCLLFLIAVAVIRVFKWWQQGQGNDKIMLSPLPSQINSLVIVDLLATVLSVLLHPQPASTYLAYIATTGFLVAAGHHLPPLTIIIAFFNLMVLLQIKRNFQQRAEQKIRTRLGIRQTNSIYFTPSSPPKK